jgi:hypothetical protein
MATQHSTQERKTVPIVFAKHPDYPGGVLEYVTPTTAAIIKRMEMMSATGRQEALRAIRAIKAGTFDYSPAEIESWSPEQRRVAIASLPEVLS